MRIVGIDPGKKGAVVTITRSQGSIIDMWAMEEDKQGLVLHLEKLLLGVQEKGHLHVFLEKAQAMPKNGAVSMFNYGTGYGIIQGILLALKIPHTLVPPGLWTKQLHAGIMGSLPKKKSLEAARRLFPEVDLKDPCSPRSKVPHEGIVDALLIAEYGRRHSYGD